MRIIGIISVFNEELMIETCLKHHLAQGIEIYLIDNGSTDGTMEIARKHLGHGVAGLSALPREGVFDLRKILRKKQDLARRLNADWFLNLDADEIRLPPEPGQTLAQAIEVVDRAGYNAVNFLEFTFIPTLEAPDHTHVHFLETMRWYYPFLPRLLHRVDGWKKQPKPVSFGGNGHTVKFPRQVIYPIPFRVRHYQFLSLAHAAKKYALKRHPVKVDDQDRREPLDIFAVRLPSSAQLHEVTDDGRLNFTHPRSTHYVNIFPSFALDEKDGRLTAREKLKSMLNFVEGVDYRRF